MTRFNDRLVFVAETSPGNAQLWTIDDTRMANERLDDWPSETVLEAVYPNPFRSRASFEVRVPASQPVTIQVFDLLGRPVKEIYDGTLHAGSRTVFSVEADDLSAGRYFLRLEGASIAETRPLVIVR